MDRRTVLSGIGAGGVSLFGGCAGTTRRASDTPPETLAVVSVETVERFDPAFFVTASVTAVRPWITTDRTAIVELTLRNDGPFVHELVAGDGNRPVLSATTSVGDGQRIALPTATEPGSYPPATRRETTPTDGCWRLQAPVGFPTKEIRLTRLAPGDTVSLRTEVWGHHENDDCLPTGTFEFRETYRRRKDTIPIEWGFTLRLD